MKTPYIPKELVNIILEYDGTIKYYKNVRKYINIIHKNDERYNIIQKLISKKLQIIKTIHIIDNRFYFEFGFDIDNRIGLCYDYNFSFKDEFEICFFNFKNVTNGWEQIRTYF